MLFVFPISGGSSIFYLQRGCLTHFISTQDVEYQDHPSPEVNCLRNGRPLEKLRNPVSLPDHQNG